MAGTFWVAEPLFIFYALSVILAGGDFLRGRDVLGVEVILGGKDVLSGGDILGGRDVLGGGDIFYFLCFINSSGWWRLSGLRIHFG